MGADPPGDRPKGDDDVVRPEELDFTRDENVATLENDRFLISTGGRIPENVHELDAGPDDPESADVLEALAGRVADVDEPYGFSITASFDGRVEQHERFSDDLAAVFDELVTWYARQVASETDPAEVIGILLLASERRVQFPRRALIDLLEAHDVSPDDSVSDLITALEGDGIRFPPES